MFWTSQLEPARFFNRCHMTRIRDRSNRKVCPNGAAATISCPNGHATVCLWIYMVSSENSVFAGASTYTTCNVSFFSACGCLPPSNQMFQQRRRVSHRSTPRTQSRTMPLRRPCAAPSTPRAQLSWDRGTNGCMAWSSLMQKKSCQMNNKIVNHAEAS